MSEQAKSKNPEAYGTGSGEDSRAQTPGNSSAISAEAIDAQAGAGLAKNRRSDSRNGARLVFVQTRLLNALVSVAKLVCGFATNTLSMVADGFHSLLDASSNIIGIIGLSISMKPADTGHPYGHHKFEPLAAIAISFMMFFACFKVSSGIMERILNQSDIVPTVGMVSYVVMVLSLVINVLVTWYERKKAKELGSTLLHADSEHTLSDIYVSLGVICSLVAAQFHFFVVDIVVSILIVLAILKAGLGIIEVHMGTLVDASVLSESDVENLVLSVPGVKSCHKIRSRGVADYIFIDLHVQVDGDLTVTEGHKIAYKVEDRLKNELEGVEDVIVHIEEVESV